MSVVSFHHQLNMWTAGLVFIIHIQMGPLLEVKAKGIFELPDTLYQI